MDTIKDPLQREAAEIAVNEFWPVPQAALRVSPSQEARLSLCGQGHLALSTAASTGKPWVWKCFQDFKALQCMTIMLSVRYVSNSALGMLYERWCFSL